jgi:hypothetical protein
MLSKCANPGCPAPFLYLHQGKLFHLESATGDPASQATNKPARRIEFFWLCDECASGLTLRYNRQRGISVIPSQKMPARGGASAGGSGRIRQLSSPDEGVRGNVTVRG